MKSRKNEARRLLRNCFENTRFSLVPFEIWRDIVSFADAKSIVLLSQTCWGFKELFCVVTEKNFLLALMLRREGQIPLARKCLLMCAENKNSSAMFHLGYAYYVGGWGLKEDACLAAEWIKRAVDEGNADGLGILSLCFSLGAGVEKDQELSNFWAEKALISESSFAVGCCLFYGLGVQKDMRKAYDAFELCGTEGCEFGQLQMAYFKNSVHQFKLAFSWASKAAIQGSFLAQACVANYYRHGVGVEQNEEMANFWQKRANMQRE